MKKFIKNFEEILSSVALAIIIVVVVLNVIMRYFLSKSFNWAEEIATIGFVWCIFLGASACYKRSMHIGIDVIVRFLPARVEKIISLGISILLLVANVYVAYLSLVFSLTAWIKPTAVLLIPYTFVDIPAFLGFSLMAIHSARNLINQLKGKSSIDANNEEIVLEI